MKHLYLFILKTTHKLKMPNRPFIDRRNAPARAIRRLWRCRDKMEKKFTAGFQLFQYVFERKGWKAANIQILHTEWYEPARDKLSFCDWKLRLQLNSMFDEPHAKLLKSAKSYPRKYSRKGISLVVLREREEALMELKKFHARIREIDMTAVRELESQARTYIRDFRY